VPDINMNKVIQYVRESKEELLHKVSWPTWSELQNSALIVVIATSMIAVIIFVMDYVFGNVI
jgi:preprotein translocase subunit SecE